MLRAPLSHAKPRPALLEGPLLPPLHRRRHRPRWRLRRPQRRCQWGRPAALVNAALLVLASPVELLKNDDSVSALLLEREGLELREIAPLDRSRPSGGALEELLDETLDEHLHTKVACRSESTCDRER